MLATSVVQLCVCVCQICYLRGEHRTGAEGVQVLSAVWGPQANPATVPACGLTAAQPLEGPLGSDSTGQFFLGLAGMFAQSCLPQLHRS